LTILLILPKEEGKDSLINPLIGALPSSVKEDKVEPKVEPETVIDPTPDPLFVQYKSTLEQKEKDLIELNALLQKSVNNVFSSSFHFTVY
jgi:hypothetical protein